MQRILQAVGIMLLIIGLGFTVNLHTVAQESTCPGAPMPRLVIGQQARVTPGLPNNLRSGAGIWNTRIGQIPGNSSFLVLAGPVCAGYYNWWQVNYQGKVGWTAEGIYNTYWLEPLGGTTSTTLLSLRVDPVNREEGGFLILTPNTTATIMLSSTPPDAAEVRFYLTDSTTGAASLLGTDTNLRDGAIIRWLVPAGLRGHLSARVYNSQWQATNGTDNLAVMADGTAMPPTATPPTSGGTFVHNTLGFQMEVPAGWSVQETSTGALITQPLNKLQLLVTESPPSGLPAGDRITFTDFATGLGIDLRRDNLIYQGRVKAAIYQYQGQDQIPFGDRHLYIMLMDVDAHYEAIDIPDSVLSSVDQMVATLHMVVTT